jgi:hypothetical protein
MFLCVLAACNKSLFDNNGNPDARTGTGGGDGDIPSSCPATCLADAGHDFDGTPGGMGNHWGYFDDVRTRKWSAMTAMSGIFVGADAANKISSCSKNPSAEACSALPGALLVNSSGATSGADPSIAYTAMSSQVITLSIAVFVPASAPSQVVRLYRNSREDVLFTQTATPGVMLGHGITVDALPGDRFFVALAPMAMGAGDVGVQFFASAPGMVFPSKCQLAVPFSTFAGFKVDNLCVANKLTYFNDMTGTVMTAPTLAAGPFPEMGQAADIVPDRYYETAAILDKAGDTTIQFWIKHRSVVMFYGAHVFSDIDLDSPGGIDFDIYDNGSSGINLDVTTTTATNPAAFAMTTAPFPTDHAWHFIRATHANGTVTVCIDGTKKASFALAAGKLGSTYHPYMGRNVRWTPAGSYFDGGLDDVRVLSTALPCE